MRLPAVLIVVALTCLAVFLARPHPERGSGREADPDEQAEAYADDALAFRRAQLQDHSGKIARGAIVDAARQAASLRLRSAARLGARSVAGIPRGAWTPIGPGNVGGRTRALAISPVSPQTMWAGSASGGIWKTTNGGQSWQPLDDFIASLRVASLVIDPANTAVLYAGTGESFTSHKQDFIPGAGIFKTTDGGRTWSQLASTQTSDFSYVNRLAIDPGDSNLLLAATETGIWRSTDAGASAWTHELTARLADVNFDPTDGSKGVAGGYGAAYYTTNGGGDWTAASGLPGSGRVEIAYARSNPDVVYASVDANQGEVYRSTNGGHSFALANTGHGYLGNQGSYDDALWVDPTDPSVFVVGGIDLWRGTGSGATLTKISDWRLGPPNDTLSAHADQHAIVEAPGYNGTSNRTVYFGNDGGVFEAPDVSAAATNSGWQGLNHTYASTQFYSGDGNANGRIVGGTQDNGTPAYQGGTETWTSIFGGDGGSVSADRTNASYLYGEYVYGQVFRNTNGGVSGAASSSIWGLAGFDAQGNAIPKSAPYVIGDARDQNANFIAPILLDPNEPNRLLVGGASLWRTNDARTANTSSTGPQWSAIRGAFTPVDSRGTCWSPSVTPTSWRCISAIAVQPGNSDVIWIGYDNGLIYKTTNGTAASPTWTRVDTDAMPARFVLRITIDPTDPGIVYTTFGGFASDNVWRTTDGGATAGGWTARAGTGADALPSAPVRDIAVNPANHNWIYAGTEIGVFASTDGGAHWSVPQGGPANVSADQLFWLGNDLVAATHGRGMFRTDVTIPQPPNDDFASAQTLTGTSATRPADTNLGANKEAGEPDHAGNRGGASVWYSWTPASSGETTIDTRQSAPDTTLGVYTGNAVDGLTEVTSNDDEDAASNVFTSKVTFTATAGVTYRIAVDGFRSTNGVVSKGSLALHLAETPTAGARTLTVSRAGTGSGTVTSQPAGIDCGATCAHDFADGATVTLTAAPATGSTFAGWSGDCAGTATTCQLTMDAAKNATATFTTTAVSRTLTVSRAGTGSGTVTSQPPGVDCGATCAHDFSDGATVTLTAAPATGSSFVGWSGDCTGAATTCQLTMDDDRNATATFITSNDLFASPLALTGGSGTVTTTNVGAGKEPGEPAHAGNAGGASVWFDYTPASRGALELDTVGSTPDTLLAVYTGTNVASLTLVAANDDEDNGSGILTSRLTAAVTGGTRYRIAVDGFDGATGPIQLHWHFTADASPPQNPTLAPASGSPAIGTWSRARHIGVAWSGAADAATAVHGYSYAWDRSPSGTPDTTEDASAETATATSPSLPDGSDHWFHLRTRDDAANWSAPVHLGPFKVDATSPVTGGVTSSTHLPGVPSLASRVTVAWPSARDATSGLDEYSYAWDTNPGTQPDTVGDAPATKTSTTSPPLPPGSYWFHLRARDVAGNWSAATHAGPFVVSPMGSTGGGGSTGGAGGGATGGGGGGGTAPARCVVPKVTGKRLGAAKAALRRAHCRTGRITRAYSARVKRGRVVRQRPRARARRPAGTKVTLVLSRGRR